MEREILVKFLIREDELRRSPEVQKLYSQNFACGNDYLNHIRDVTENLQRQILQELGFEGTDLENAIERVRSHRFHYANDEEILALSVYGRHDNSSYRSPEEFAKILPPLDTINLCNLNEKKISLEELISPNRLTLVIATSIS